MEQEKDSDPDAQKAREESKCKVLPDETVNGQQASVFVETTPELETKVWISRASKLPIQGPVAKPKEGQ